MNNFQWPQPHLLSTWAAEFVDWWGKKIEQSDKRIVFYKGKHWFIKHKPDPEELKRDYLAYLLGRKWANVAEVSPLSEHEFKNLVSLGVPLPGYASTNNTFLVRLAQDYTPDELPNANIDSAVASEVVFSLWSRRRDAHAANRVYNNKIPIFFDHQTAFLGEPHLADLNTFFQLGNDVGHAGRWRIRVLENANVVCTKTARQADRDENLAIHLIKNPGHYENSLQSNVQYLKGQSRIEWLEATLNAGYEKNRAIQIVSFLTENCHELDSAIKKMWPIGNPPIFT